jgi:hypothetical protein
MLAKPFKIVDMQGEEGKAANSWKGLLARAANGCFMLLHEAL